MYNSGIGTPYWFEWEIGILECLNMLQDISIESVILQSTDFQALDDGTASGACPRQKSINFIKVL